MSFLRRDSIEPFLAKIDAKRLHEIQQRYAGSADRNAFTRRMGSYLQRRGYTFEVIRPIIDQLWAEISETADADPDDQ